jgi:hypothetical protein
MSSHSSSHTSHSGSGFFSTPDTWLATKHAKDSNPLHATEDVAHNTVDAVVSTGSQYIADILNQFKYAGKNLLAVREHGWKSLPRWVLWAITNTAKAATNAITGIPHALDRVVTKWVNDSVVDISSGTVDNIPLVGKPVGNIAKLGSGILNAPTRFFSWITQKIPDKAIDWINSISLVKPSRHLGYAKWESHGHGGWDHH